MVAKQYFVVAKRYTVASVFVAAAFMGTCSNSVANNDGSCAGTCASDYGKALKSCPPLDRDAEAYFLCVVKAQDRQEVCDSGCPNYGLPGIPAAPAGSRPLSAGTSPSRTR